MLKLSITFCNLLKYRYHQKVQLRDKEIITTKNDRSTWLMVIHLNMELNQIWVQQILIKWC